MGQEYAARAIWHLCASIHNQGTVVDEGTIVELVALSRTGSEKAQELSAAVISDLARGAIIERERAISSGQLAEEAAAPPESAEDHAAALEEEASYAPLLAALDDGTTKKRVIDIFRELDRTGAAASRSRSSRSDWARSRCRTRSSRRSTASLTRATPTATACSTTQSQQDAPLGQRDHARERAARRRDGQDRDQGQESDQPAPRFDRRGRRRRAIGCTCRRTLRRACRAAQPKQGRSAERDRRGGGIYPLVGLVTSGSLMGKERAAGALWHLSVDSINRMIIAKAGGIAPLVQLLDDGTLQAHIHVAVALGRLALNNPDNQAQIAKKLVGLVGLTHRPGAQQRAAHTLWELAHNNAGAPVIIVNAGAISPLVMLLSTGVSEAKRRPRARCRRSR